MVYFNYDIIEGKALDDFLFRYGVEAGRLVGVLKYIYSKEVYNNKDEDINDKFSKSSVYALCCFVYDKSLFKDKYDTILTLSDLDMFLTIFNEEEVERDFKDYKSDKVTFYGCGVSLVFNAIERRARHEALLGHLLVNEYGEKIDIDSILRNTLDNN